MAQWSDNLASFDGDLVGAYNLEETTGPVLDNGPTSNNGAINNTVTRGVTGVIGNGFNFTGAGFLTLDNPTPVTTFTVAGWFKVSGAPSGQDDFLFAYRNGTSVPNYIQVVYRQSGKVSINIDGSGSDAGFDSSSNLPTGSFVHVAFIGDGSTCTLYFDAVSVGSASYSGSVTGNTWSVGGATDNSFLYTGDVDMPYIWTTDISTSALTDLVNGGAGLEFSVPRSTYTHTAPFIDGLEASTYTHSSPFIDGSGATTYLHTSSFIDGAGATAYTHTSIFIKGEKVKVTYIHTSPFIAGRLATTYTHTSPFIDGAGATTYLHTSPELRGEGVMSYFIDIRDSDDIQVATATGVPPTTVFIDVATGLDDGDYIAYVRSVQKFMNLENVIDNTLYKFTLVSGLTVDPFPNEILSLSPEVIKDADVILTWTYLDTGQSVAPDSFEVYIDAVLSISIPYTESGNYTTTLTSLPEVLTTFKVTAKASTQETDGLEVTATPDGTPPAEVPFQFEVS